MLEKSPYPLLTLKLLGSLCPCLEREEDGPARQAAWALANVPIRWHRRLRGSSSSGEGGGSVGGFISGMFGKSTGSLVGGDSYEPLEGATLSVVDAGSSGPHLVASPPGFSAIRKKSIPLRVIKKVQAQKGGIITSGSRSGIEILDSTGREILRFDVLKSAPMSAAGDNADEEDWENTEASGGGSAEDAEESARDDIIDQLEMLIEWERRRQARIVVLGEDDAENNEEETYVDEYDDDGDGTGSSPKRKRGAIAEKAQQMKHFAQREIELQKTKKEREARKAKYVKEAGGLKYTAIAMANRS